MVLPAPSRPAVLVVVADAGWLDHAMQVFASAHHHGGWDGDMLLLAHDVPNQALRRFRQRGILAVSAAPLTTPRGQVFGPSHQRLRMFTDAFAQWESLVYLDADVLVRGSLDGLKGRTGLWAVPDLRAPLEAQIEFERDDEPEDVLALREALWQRCQRSWIGYNSGVMAFDRGMCDDQLLEELLHTIDEFGPILRFKEQSAINIALSPTINPLPVVYNTMVRTHHNVYGLAPERLGTIVLHTVDLPKAWAAVRTPYHREYLDNLALAEEMDVTSPRSGIPWSDERVARVSADLDARKSLEIPPARMLRRRLVELATRVLPEGVVATLRGGAWRRTWDTAERLWHS